MKYYKLAETEEKFAELIWQNEPIGSGDLVKLSEKEMNWKKSTTYTVLKKLCEKGIFQNKNAMVSSLIKKDEYYAKQSIRFVEDTFARDNVINPIIFTGLATIFYNIMFSLFMYFLSRNITFIAAVKSVFSLEILYNCLVSIIIYKIFYKIFSEPKIRFNKR